MSILSSVIPAINWLKLGIAAIIVLVIISIGTGFYYYNKHKDAAYAAKLQELSDKIQEQAVNISNLKIENDTQKQEIKNLGQDIKLTNQIVTSLADGDKKVREELNKVLVKIDRRKLDELKASPNREMLLDRINRYFDRMRQDGNTGRSTNSDPDSVPDITDAD